ncbi:hypothetical protein [Maribacter arcticus]|jgi:hypothetical protein|uniref:Uncharacterized protein n=1 Tax=Maribacter arcticus TaxID=561365 RepID=A0A1T5D0Z7_9FLAO|nr:hypothetical protein [Maribacter arcticus]SKB65408.1 hypothetical protein SAMN05660866_02591 [Maribacter arcticus]|tara:strand:- start:2722 stop:3204 length:483 start_codon:yes stop_codon:yes gene_type:complete
MNFIQGVLTWKRTLILSIGVLALLNIFSFYGLYTNKFYFFKIDNYIFPLLSIVHFVFLYVLWFKIKEDELSDPPMRTLEYVLYIISLVYVYKLVETIIILLSYNDFDNHLIPSTFLPLGYFMLLLYTLLLLVTYLAIAYRKKIVGTYLFDDMNQHVDHWK